MENFDLHELFVVAPELMLLMLACVILIIDLFLTQSSQAVTTVLSKIALALVGLVIILGQSQEIRYAFSEMYVADPVSDFLKLAACGSVLTMLIYSNNYLLSRGIYRGEFFTLTLFALLGMMIMISANHFLILYLGLELLSLSLYSMVALPRGLLRSSEAAIKYFVLGAMASGLLLYGMSMIYGATGSLYLPEISSSLTSGVANMDLALFGLVFLVAGIAFKLGAVPFHMWVPDVYQGAPTAVTMLIGTAPKLAAFAFVFRLLV